MQQMQTYLQQLQTYIKQMQAQMDKIHKPISSKLRLCSRCQADFEEEICVLAVV
jgi:hypothetical protein